MEKLTYREFCDKMREFNETHKWAEENITGVIVFTEDSFKDYYPVAARSYAVSSENKAWIPGMSGYSIYGGSLDRSDTCTRLEQYIDVEYGGDKGWHVDYCYFVDELPKVTNYEFVVNLCGGCCGGHITISATTEEEAYNEAANYVASKLTKAFPMLDIEYNVELKVDDKNE